MAIGLGSYDLARSGLLVAERALNVTGHNIANENTAGYIRQRAITTNSPYIGLQKFQSGLGAKVEEVTQLRNMFLDIAYRAEVKHQGYWEAKQSTIQDIQAIMGEPGEEGLQEVMNQFWDSWQELSKNPESLTVRALTRQRGYTLVRKFNRIGQQLDQLQKNINTETLSRIQEINKINAEIVKYNKQIVVEEYSREKANDYKDQRNYLIDKLAKLMDIDVAERADGQVDITVAGQFLVVEERFNKIYDSYKEVDGVLLVVPKLDGYKSELRLTSGSMKGLTESNMQLVTDLRRQLNLMVENMAGKVNEYCRDGKNLIGEQGTDFFAVVDPNRPFSLANIQLNGNLTNLNNIVSSETGSQGDNLIALKIADLRHEKIDFSGVLHGETSIDEFYRRIILDFANEGFKADQMLESQITLVTQADNLRKSIGGVSLDEEMTNMMKFQFAYNASSRTLNVLDEMLETVINRLGVAGR